MKRGERASEKRNIKTYRIINTLCCYLLSKTDSPKCFTLDPFRGVCSLRHRLCSFVSCLSLDTTYFSPYNKRLAVQKMSVRAKTRTRSKTHKRNTVKIQSPLSAIATLCLHSIEMWNNGNM